MTVHLSVDSIIAHVRAVGACPVERDTPLISDRQINRHRRIFCRHYNMCLNVAMRAGWASFSCARCPIREEYTVEERRAQAARIYRVYDENNNEIDWGVD